MESVKVAGAFDAAKETKFRTYFWVDKENITTPKTGLTAYVDYYWLLNEDGQVCLYEGYSPQANPHRIVCEKLMSGVPGAVSIELIPVAYLERR
jgi:hypothetical protein